MIKEIVKIEIKNQTLDFSARERFINTEIQKLIDGYNNRGYIVISHSILNKNNRNVGVQFDLQPMPR